MKLGIYGGSFNPPHLGHLRAAEDAARFLGLDRLLLIPAGIPPHKQLSENAPGPEHRAAMTALMAEQVTLSTGIPVEMSRMELQRAGKSYTVDTVRALRKEYPDAELWLLMGTDMFLSFESWYQPEEILRCVNLCAFGRSEDDSSEMLERQRAHLAARWSDARFEVMILPDVVEISSTELRTLLPGGLGAQYLTPQIFGYILREHLYGTNLDLKRLSIEELRPIALSYLKAKRVKHVLGTEREAISLAERFGADVDKARVAALLHDSTKRLSAEEQFALCEHYGLALDAVERENPHLLHARTGAALARDVFGVDEEIADAIRWHTTGHENMTLLEKVIYLADYIEPNRSFPGVDALRAAVRADLDRGLLMALEKTVERLGKGNTSAAIHPDSVKARDYLQRSIENGSIQR